LVKDASGVVPPLALSGIKVGAYVGLSVVLILVVRLLQRWWMRVPRRHDGRNT
jgi:hypothetical protein